VDDDAGSVGFDGDACKEVDDRVVVVVVVVDDDHSGRWIETSTKGSTVDLWLVFSGVAESSFGRGSCWAEMICFETDR
jgi:hypothetical protein